MTFNCKRYKEGTKFPSHAIKSHNEFKEHEYKSIQHKGENHSSQVWKITEGDLMCSLLRSKITSSIASEVLHMKDADSPVHLVT